MNIGMSTLYEAIVRRLDAIHRGYDTHFAGQARVTRDPRILDSMLAEVSAVEEEAAGLDGSEREALEERVADRRALYRGELKSIAETCAGHQTPARLCSGAAAADCALATRPVRGWRQCFSQFS